MKSSATMKKPTLKLAQEDAKRILSTFKLSADQKKGSEEEEEEKGSSGELMAKAKSKSKLDKSTKSSSNSNTSFTKDKSTATNANLNQSQSQALPLPVSWKDSLRDFSKSSRPKILTRPETLEMSVTGPASAKGSRARRPASRALGSTPARSSARLRLQAKQTAGLNVGVSGSRQVVCPEIFQFIF